MTLREIAKLANVSRSAVSLALNNRPGVSEETRDRILEIARQNGYIPRSIVRAENVYQPVRAIRIVACVKSEVIGPEFHHAPFFSELIQGLEQENRRRGYSLVFSTVSESSITDQLNDLERDHPAEGIILLGTNLSADEVESIQRIHPTLVLLDAFFPSLNVESVVMNNYMGAAQAASLVRRLGHIHIGYVGSHQRIPNFDQRQATFEEKIKAARLGIAREHRWFVRPTIDGAREDLTGQLRSTDALPTIAFCENDYLAIGLIKACVDVGVDVPGQLSVVGFDDIPQSSVVQPELTTIRVDKRRMASTALSQLINLAESGDRATKTSCLIGTTLVERGSTSPPRWK